ncbi:hypothetical protein ACFVUN_11785 [Kitasatospora griseola]|uniref:hypothetical protein n=1 Tax=Kitasatospora griseola TaxID=2064 RepID=UPI0036DEF85E
MLAGFNAPVALIRLIEGGTFSPDCDSSRIEEIFRESDSYRFDLYDRSQIVRESCRFREGARSDGETRSLFVRPGLGIDPESTLLIGDLGADMPIALDYRIDLQRPRVLYLGVGGWIEVAENFDSFCNLILAVPGETFK